MFDLKRDLLAVSALAALLYAEQWAGAGHPPTLLEVHVARATRVLNVQAHALVEHTHAWVLSLLPELECTGSPGASAVPARCNLN